MVQATYQSLSFPLLSQDQKEILVKKTLEDDTNFFAYTGQRTGKPDGNHIYVRGILRELDFVQKIVHSCTIDCYPLVMKHFPNTPVPIHVDNPNGRNCVIITPLIPSEGYVPTLFWKTFTDTEPFDIADFSDGLPKLINTQTLHSLTNTDKLRMNFQICFEKPFSEVRDLIIENKLFKENFLESLQMQN